MDLPLSWHTDLAVLELEGSTIDHRSDHLVVRTPANPAYYWGNFVLVTDPSRVDEPAHWLEAFEREFPDAAHRAIGLVTQPVDPGDWEARGLEITHDDVRVAEACPDPTPVPQGYLVKQITDAIEWEQSSGLRISEFSEGDPREAEHERRRTAARRALSEQGRLAWFGAFHGDRLVAELGIVDCGGGVARYQSVVTGAEHRRQGLAGHLLGVAAGWAAAQGVERWVIVADAGSDAGRLYRSRGFAPAEGGARAQRRPSQG